MKYIAVSVVVLILVSAFSSVFTRTIHVEQEKSFSSEGNIVHFRLIQAAVDQAQPGDTILVHEGDYEGCRISEPGSPDAWITLKAVPGLKVHVSRPGPKNKHRSIEVGLFNHHLTRFSQTVRWRSPAEHILVNDMISRD